MKTRNVTITLEEARELYQGGKETLRNLALQAFSKEELTENSFLAIRTFDDAVDRIGFNHDYLSKTIEEVAAFSKASAAMLKLNIVRMALNLGQDMRLTVNEKESNFIWFPFNPLASLSSTHYAEEIKADEMEIIGKVKYRGEEYNVLGACVLRCAYAGLGYFDSGQGIGYAEPSSGFLGCTSKEIAIHFGKYFGMLITEAKFGDLEGFEMVKM